jgi:hypothetical protein
MNQEICKTEQVTLQENGIVRNAQGVIIGHLVEDLDELCAKHNKIGYKQGYRAGQLDEREACAKVCEDRYSDHPDLSIASGEAGMCAYHIRARGEA